MVARRHNEEISQRYCRTVLRLDGSHAAVSVQAAIPVASGAGDRRRDHVETTLGLLGLSTGGLAFSCCHVGSRHADCPRPQS